MALQKRYIYRYYLCLTSGSNDVANNVPRNWVRAEEAQGTTSIGQSVKVQRTST